MDCEEKLRLRSKWGVRRVVIVLGDWNLLKRRLEFCCWRRGEMRGRGCESVVWRLIFIMNVLDFGWR